MLATAIRYSDMPTRSLRSDMFALLVRVRSSARAILPREPVDLPPADVHVFGMFSRTLRFFDGIVALLEKNLPEEALVLARSLFVDALRLAELEQAGKERIALILGWVNSSIAEKRGLIEDAVRKGLETDPTQLFAKFDEEERKLRAYAANSDVGRFGKFQSVAAAAMKFERKHDYWTYALAHELVHGSDASFVYSRSEPAPTTIAVHDRTTDPVILAGAGCFAAMSLLQAAAAVGNMFARPGVVQLRLLASEIQELADRKG